MTPEKVRIKKYQQDRIDQWCDALGVPAARFVEDALNFYLQYLDGKNTLVNHQIQITQPRQLTVEPEIVEPETDDDFTGDLEL